jgi:4-hydroxybenzoate polyprenyltransferase
MGHGLISAISRALRFIRFSHTVFAMPFALGALFVAAQGWPGWRLLGLVLLALVFARTAAMCFNRVVDWEIDQQNPRTIERHTLISKAGAIAMLAGSSAGFVATAAWINPLCFALSPVALAMVFFYSLTKRFTHFSHFFLGLALAVAPVGAWLAVRGRFDIAPLVLGLGVLLWVAGFDMIYATLDESFDRTAGLHSWAVRHGTEGCLRWAQGLHLAMFAIFCAFGWLAGLGTAFWLAMAVVAAALVYEHRTAARRDVRGVNAAFFYANAVVGLAFVTGVFFDRVPLR